MICNYSYISDGFKYNVNVMNLSDSLILNIRGVDYSVYIAKIDKKRCCEYFKQF